jgi:hypothetical protein
MSPAFDVSTYSQFEEKCIYKFLRENTVLISGRCHPMEVLISTAKEKLKAKLDASTQRGRPCLKNHFEGELRADRLSQ